MIGKLHSDTSFGFAMICPLEVSAFRSTLQTREPSTVVWFQFRSALQESRAGTARTVSQRNFFSNSSELPSAITP